MNSIAGRTLLTLFAVFALLSCDIPEGGGEAGTAISGYAQKGQFIKGSAITVYALDGKLAATGESFPGMIKDDLGSFEITAGTRAPYLELRAEGYYFVENTGEISAAPIYLSSLVSSSCRKANVNLLTTFTGGRIRKLIGEGKSFEEAKETAEKEVLTALAMNTPDFEDGFEELNISEDGVANGILLAASCLIQEGRTAGEIQKLISDISSEFEEEGKLSGHILAEIFGREVSIAGIVGNLIRFYQGKGMADFDIPPFYSYVDDEFAVSGFRVIQTSVSVVEIYNMEQEGGTKSYYAVSSDEFIINSDADWLTAEAVELSSGLYQLVITAAANPDYASRSGNIHVKSGKGDILYTDNIRQRGNGQRLCLQFPEIITKGGTGTKAMESEDRIHVNGVEYVLGYDSDLRMVYVDVPKSDKGYGVTTMPDFVSPAANGDPLCATFRYGSEINEYIVSNSPEGIPYYGAVRGLPGMELQNPAVVKLENPCVLVTFNFKFDASLGEDAMVSRLELCADEEGFLSGEITECMYPDQALMDPTYTMPATVCKDKSNKVTVYNTDGDNRVAVLIHPQSYRQLSISADCIITKNGQTESRTYRYEMSPGSMVFKKGLNYVFSATLKPDYISVSQTITGN